MSTAQPTSNTHPDAIRSSRAHWLPLICGGVPIVVTLTCYAISSGNGSVPSCNPFLQGCTSISAAGRQLPAVFLFKGAMLPLAAFMAVYWLMCADWLRALGAPGRRVATLRTVGVIGALFLVLYVTFLGSEGEAYQLMRRYGVTVYFSFSVLAQLLLARAMLAQAPNLIGGVARAKVGVCLMLLLLGLGVTLPEAFMEVSGEAQNTVEWNFALLMHVNFLLTWFAWRRSRLTTALAIDVS